MRASHQEISRLFLFIYFANFLNGNFVNISSLVVHLVK